MNSRVCFVLLCLLVCRDLRVGVPLLGKMGSLNLYSPEFRQGKFYNYFLRMEDLIRLPGKGNWYTSCGTHVYFLSVETNTCARLNDTATPHTHHTHTTHTHTTGRSTLSSSFFWSSGASRSPSSGLSSLVRVPQNVPFFLF